MFLKNFQTLIKKQTKVTGSDKIDLYVLRKFLENLTLHVVSNIIEPGHEKMCLMSYANNKGADQPAHSRSLISAFVVRCLDSIIHVSLDSSRNFKNLASFCCCACWFVSGLVGNSRRHVLSCRGSYNKQ